MDDSPTEEGQTRRVVQGQPVRDHAAEVATGMLQMMGVPVTGSMLRGESRDARGPDGVISDNELELERLRLEAEDKQRERVSKGRLWAGRYLLLALLLWGLYDLFVQDKLQGAEITTSEGTTVKVGAKGAG